MEWKEYKLKELCLKIGSGATPSGGKEAYKGGDFNLIRSQNVLDFGFSWDGLAQINDQQASELRNVELKEGDVLLNITGDSVARACLIPNSVLPARVNQHVAIVRADQKTLDNHYLLYFLQQQKRKLLNMSSGGATRKALTKAMIEDFPISLPPLSTQRRISSILSSLDRKIELNNQINKQLEEMAQAIFKSWFIDFEPFKDGEFVDSELGRIPKGWRVGTLNEVCKKITDGSHFSPQHNEQASIPMLSVKDMDKYGFNYQNCKLISEEDYISLKNSDCCPLLNDILIAKDGSYLKEIFICKEEIKQAILSSIAIFRTNATVILPSYLLYFLKSPQVMKDVKDNYVSGSAVPRIVLKDFKKLPLIVPSLEVQNKFNALVGGIIDSIYNNVKQNSHLSSLRDTLLPKLMSGEINLEQYGNQ